MLISLAAYFFSYQTLSFKHSFMTQMNILQIFAKFWDFQAHYFKAAYLGKDQPSWTSFFGQPTPCSGVSEICCLEMYWKISYFHGHKIWWLFEALNFYGQLNIDFSRFSVHVHKLHITSLKPWNQMLREIKWFHITCLCGVAICTLLDFEF